MASSKHKQQGLSMTGFIVGAFLLIIVAVFGMKTVPAYIHSSQISQIFTQLAAAPALRGASMKEIEIAYNKRASIDDIRDLHFADVTVENDGGTLVLSANYTVKIPLAGNATLLLEFNPSSK